MENPIVPTNPFNHTVDATGIDLHLKMNTPDITLECPGMAMITIDIQS